MISASKTESASASDTSRSRPLLANARATAGVSTFSRPGSRVRFMKIGTATVRMCGGRLPREAVAAAGEGGGESEAGDEAAAPPRHPRVTMLTSRPGTTTTLATARPASHGCTRSSARARSRISGSGGPASTVSASATRPSTWTTISTSSRTRAAASALGHGAANRLSAWPSAAQSSSAMCGRHRPEEEQRGLHRLAEQGAPLGESRSVERRALELVERVDQLHDRADRRY